MTLTLETLRGRFEAYFLPEPNSGCWIWERASRDGRYGRFRMGHRHEAAHRAAWMLYRGDIPQGLLVCHRCDVTFCVNPLHLFLGTHADNMADRNAKGRAAGQAPGEANAQAKLSAASVAAVRLDPRTQKEIANQYRVSPSTISLIKSGKRWSATSC